MTAAEKVGRMGSGAIYFSMLLRRLGLLILGLGALHYGVTAVQGYMPYDTVATIESAYGGKGVCVARDFQLFKMLSYARMKNLSEEELRAEHARQCEGPNTVNGNITVLLAWNDHAMGEHKTWIVVSPATAQRLIERGRLRRGSVRIRYTSTGQNATVALMEEIEAHKADAGKVMAVGGVLFLLGVPGGLLARWRRMRPPGREPAN